MINHYAPEGSPGIHNCLVAGAEANTIREALKTALLDEGPELPNSSIMGWKKPLIIKAWKKGLSVRDVGEIFDVSHSTVHEIVKQLDRLSDDRHRYEPNKRFPFQCEHCGYPEHETLKHLPSPPASTGERGE